MTKNIVKFGGGAAVIIVLGVGALFLIDYLRYQKSPEYRAIKEVERIKKEYEEDPYGGDTPEETLRLFIEALKQGDTELAAKYFVWDKQEEWRGDLARIKDKGLLDEMVGDLEREKYKYSISEKIVGFDVANEQNEAILSISIVRAQNGKWKIQDL